MIIYVKKIRFEAKNVALKKCSLIKNFKKIRFEGVWTELRPKLCLLRQSWAKCLEQSREMFAET